MYICEPTFIKPPTRNSRKGNSRSRRPRPRPRNINIFMKKDNNLYESFHVFASSLFSGNSWDNKRTGKVVRLCAQATPSQATPAQATPAQATPTQATPEKLKEVQATPTPTQYKYIYEKKR